ncbi:MAG: T9SS type A sorting domain-containing protein [bacterium]|nr:T9SS type A sorting domain-containing protein [bacterium]
MKSLIHFALKLLVAFTLTTIANTALFAQPPDTLWTRTFGGGGDDSGWSVQQTSDSGYIIAGQTTSYGAGNQDVYLIKTNANGNLVWQHTFGGSDSDGGHSVRQTTDGGYVIVGLTVSYGAGGINVYLIKTNAVGDTVWTHTFGGNGDDDSYSVQQTSDGGYVIAGLTGSYGAGGYNVYLIKTDDVGNLAWQRTFGGNDNDYGFSVQQTTDGGYVIAGLTTSYGAGNQDVYLIKTNGVGNLVWQRTFGGNDNDYGYSVQQTTDGGYVIAGETTSYGAGENDVYLIKTDTAGNMVWQRTIGDNGHDCSFSVQQTTDGGYIIAGWKNYNDVYLIKTNAGGGMLDINTSPISPPISIPRNGGSFQYNINVHNWTTSPQTFSIWNKVRDSANLYTQVFGPITRSLPGGANPSRVLTQSIAGSISSGTLYFISYIGTYPNTIVDSSFFTITKSTIADGNPWISESGVTGDLFDEYAAVDVDVRAQHAAPLQTDIVPNPFNPTTTIRFDLPEAALVQLEVFDINGRSVGVQHVEPLQSGAHEITFDGSMLPSGIYVYRLSAGASTASGKMVLLK